MKYTVHIYKFWMADGAREITNAGLEMFGELLIRPKLLMIRTSGRT